jgi:hypothetical protein
MRKLFFLFLVSIVAVSCDDTELNSPVVQGEVDNQFYRSRAQATTDENGNLIIKGTEFDVLTLKLSSSSVGTYVIGPNTTNRATFLRNGQLFVTSGPGTGGEIVIEKNEITGLSGRFFFEARLNGVGRVLNFSRGVFFDVPVIDGTIDVETPEDPETPGENDGG